MKVLIDKKVDDFEVLKPYLGLEETIYKGVFFDRREQTYNVDTGGLEEFFIGEMEEKFKEENYGYERREDGIFVKSPQIFSVGLNVRKENAIFPGGFFEELIFGEKTSSNVEEDYVDEGASKPWLYTVLGFPKYQRVLREIPEVYVGGMINHEKIGGGTKNLKKLIDILSELNYNLEFYSMPEKRFKRKELSTLEPMGDSDYVAGAIAKEILDE